MITQFNDFHNPSRTLTINEGLFAVEINITSLEEQGQHIALFFLDPKDFGALAAALWECSPSKPAIQIKEVPDGSNGTL